MDHIDDKFNDSSVNNADNKNDADDQFVKNKIEFINKYKQSSNTANSTIDDNSNVANKNLAILNAEIHKPDNIRISRAMVMGKLKELYPDFNSKRYVRDLEDHVIYKHDESSFGTISPYCTSVTMYPFLLDGIKGLGGLSASPKNLKSFCGIFCNMIFAISSQFAGACLYKDQQLLINKDNLNYNLKIKDLVNKFDLTNKFSNYQGDWEYTDISDQNYFVEEDEKKVRVNKVYRRKYSDEIYKIKTHSGLECCVSKDHKFKVLYRGRIIEVPARDLKQFDTVFVSTDHSCMINKNSQDYRDGQFLGIICGDGSVTNKNYVRVAIHKDQMYIKDFLDSYFSDVYGKTGSLSLDPRKNAVCYNYTVSSVSIRNKICDLLTPCERHDTYTKNVNIENKSLDFQLGFLDGLLVTDGNISIDKSIRICLTNEGLIDTIINIVKNLNVPCGRKTGGKVYDTQTNKRPVYNFCVPSKMRKYLQLTPLKAYKSSIERVSKRKDANDRHCGKELYYLGPTRSENVQGNKFICRSNSHNEAYKQCCTDVIESIETFKNDDEYVYEIETESHWYNCGGMITHNCAVSEALLYFTYFCKKEWGDDFYKRPDEIIERPKNSEPRTILKEIQQYWQQIIYTINQPAAARGFQSAFVNFSYFDKPFFEGMFGDFYFPDGTKPDFESLKWIQMEFMKWFNEERLKTVLTFPVETVTLLYKDGKFEDEEMFNFVCDEYSRGHSFFTYISDSVDSLSSCCFDKDTRIMYSINDHNHFEKCEPIGEAYNKHKDDKIEVLGFNPYTGIRKWVVGKFVKACSSDLYKITFKDKLDWASVVATHDHIFPVITNNGCIVDVAVKDLTVNSKLLADKAQFNCESEDGNEMIPVEIESIEKIEVPTDVYCIELDDHNSPYFVLANGVITHNCRLKNKLQTKEFNFTNGNIGIMTGSKSVITFNLNRLIQLWYKKECEKSNVESFEFNESYYPSLKKYLTKLLDRVYKYHHAYNELLWDMYDADLLPAYKAGFIDLNKQYLTLGLNGLNQAAEFLGIKCNVNEKYAKFCQEIFSFFKEQNELHKDKTGKHHLIFNTEQVPAESLAIKNYNWDKNDGFAVPNDTNLYASYIFKPNDNTVSVLDKIKMHGKDYIGEFLDGGAAAHINLDSHLSSKQYRLLLEYAAQVGCSYLTFNIPMSECRDCGKIVNVPIDECPSCHSKNIQMYTRIIGYLTAIKNWNDGRQKEFTTRIFNHLDDNDCAEKTAEYVKYKQFKNPISNK